MAAALLSLTDCCQSCATCNDSTTVIDDGEDSTLLGWFKRKSLAEGRAIASNDFNVKLEINGLEIGGDGEIGHYTWDENSVAVDDGASVLTPDDNPSQGRWIRMT